MRVSILFSSFDRVCLYVKVLHANAFAVNEQNKTFNPVYVIPFETNLISSLCSSDQHDSDRMEKKKKNDSSLNEKDL